MRRLSLTILMAGVLLLTATTALAAGPPLVNQTDHPFQATLEPDISIDCGTGEQALTTGFYSGVLHTLVQADGTLHINGAVHGSVTQDDFPLDGIPDATSTWTSTFGDVFRSSGGEAHHFTLNGSGTTTTTGTSFRFHVLIQTLIDQAGNTKIDILQLTCF